MVNLFNFSSSSNKPPPPPPPPENSSPTTETLKGDIQKQCLQVTLTPHEQFFVDAILLKGKPEDLRKCRDTLHNDSIFETQQQKEEEASRKKEEGKAERPTLKREKYLSERQKAHLHDNLWKIHKDRVESTPAGMWRKGVRRIIALRGLGGVSGSPSSEKKMKKSVVETKEDAKEEGEENDEGDDEKQDSFTSVGQPQVPKVERKLMTRAASKNFYDGIGFEIGSNFGGSQDGEDEDSKNKDDDQNASPPQKHSAWDVLKGDDSNNSSHNSSFGNLEAPFLILGTSAEDTSCTPHVLSPPLMEALKSHFPWSCKQDNMWLKFSLVRDGADIHSFTNLTRASKHTVLAIETLDGEVFGSFTSTPWKKSQGYFGNGQSFLWRMQKPRTTITHSLEEQAQLESKTDIFKWTGMNDMFQILTSDKIAIGGGATSDNDSFGFMIEDDLLMGTSGPSETYGNPTLCQLPSDGIFEIANLEVWSMTPFMFEEDAVKNELSMLFIEQNTL